VITDRGAAFEDSGAVRGSEAKALEPFFDPGAGTVEGLSQGFVGPGGMLALEVTEVGPVGLPLGFSMHNEELLSVKRLKVKLPARKAGQWQ
jgi:hypothetical protein